MAKMTLIQQALSSSTSISSAITALIPTYAHLGTKKYTLLTTVCILLLHIQIGHAGEQAAPHFVVQPTVAGGLLTEGHVKILNCQAVGFPPPEYRWLKDGEPLTEFSPESFLRILRVTKDDAGDYQCVAKNAAGAVFSDKTKLTVAYMRMPLTVENKTISISEGMSVILAPPDVDSVPLPAVSWQRMSQDRLSGPKYAFTQDNHLVILAADPSDSDKYQATLTNTQIGHEGKSGIIRLLVSENKTVTTVPPEIIVPPRNSTFQQASYPAVLECIASGKPIDDLETIWKKDNLELPVAGISYFFSPWNRSVTLLNVVPSHAGRYECEVRLRGTSYPPVSATAYVSVETKPLITVSPKPETASELGQEILLPCEPSGFPLPSVSWYRNTELIKLDKSERYSVLGNGSLRIKNLTFDDSGIFQCVAHNAAGETSTSTWLHVKTSPPAFLKKPENMTILDGRDVQITCEASGSPIPSVTWMFNEQKHIYSIGRMHILESGSLLISSVETKDMGKYTCIRSNNAGTISESAYLTVLVRTQIVQPPVDTKAILSSTAELQCKVFHDPEVKYEITWLFGENPVDTESNDRIQKLPDGTLRIAQARNTDVGVYTCKVTSPGGNDTRSARLDVIELPHPPNNVRAVLLDTFPKTVNVSWTKAFDGNSPITNYVVQIRKIPTSGNQIENLIPWVTAPANISGNHYFHILTNLKPSSSYEFRVSAVNGVGEGNPSLPTEAVTIPPEPPSGPPQGVVGGARSSTSIMIQWQPPAPEDHNGVLLGYVVRYKLAGYASSPWVFQNITNEAQHSCLLDDLIVWQKYQIQVAAYNEKGVGVYSDNIYIRTREGVPQSAPTDVRVRAVSSTSVRVWWKPPDPQLINGINLGYKVQTWLQTPSDEGSSPIETVLVPPSTLDPLGDHTVELTGLAKFTRYNITVLCFTNPGDGPRSNPVEVLTFEDVPDVIKSLKFEDVLDTSVRVLWGPPERANGILQGYTLKYHVKDVLETMVVKNMSSQTTEAFITGLQPVTAYTFEIFAWTSVGPGEPKVATIQSGIPPVLPGPPTKLAVSNIGAFSVVLQFTPGFNGNSSIIKWIAEGQTRRNETWTMLYEIVDPEASSVTVENLVPFTEYRIRLLAMNVVGLSPPSEPTKYFQTLQAPPSHPPYNVTVRAVNAKSLRVRWTPLQQMEWYGIPRGYNISYRPLLGNSSLPFSSMILEDHNANSFVLEKLEEFTEYEVYMQAYNDVGISSPSPLAKEKTRESVPSAGPVNVEATATSSTTVVVNWGEVPELDRNGIIEGYKVYFGAKSVPFQFKVIEGNTSSTTTLTELRKYTLYSVQVLAYTHIGDGSLSVPPVSVKTFEDVPGIPSNISFPDVSTTTARIIWDVPEEPNGEIIGYRVTYQEDRNSTVILSKELPAEDRTFKATDLSPLRHYHFTVTAKTNEGWGKVANAIVFTTNSREKPQPPSAPHISKSQIQSRQITFSWTPGRNGFAPLRYYTVQLSENEEPWRTLPVKVDPTVTTYTVTRLKPSTAYKFRIQATNDLGASDYSPSSNLTKTLPAAPEDYPEEIVVTPNTPTSVHVQWKPIDAESWNGDTQNAGYRIEYCLTSFYIPPHRMDCPSKRALGINASSITLDNLEQDRIYEIRVYAYNRQGDGPATRPVSIYVGEAVPSGSPQDVQAEALTSTELRVRWKPPLETQQNGDLLGYKVFYLVEDHRGQKEEMEAVPVAQTEVTLMDLKKYTSYRIQVLAFNPAGDGPRSASVHMRTKEDLPGPPGRLSFSDITMSSLTVNWEEPAEPNGQIRGYLVTYETALSEIDFSKQVRQKVTNTFLIVHGLREVVTYTFSVRAETYAYGPEVISNVTTGPQKGSPDSPQDLTLRHTHTAVTLQWRNGGWGDAPIQGYIIEAQPSGNSEEEWNTLVHLSNGPQTSYTISFQNLLPSTVYSFRLFARNRYGISQPAFASEGFATPSKYYLEYRQKLPFYREVWFMVMLASLSVVIIIIVVAVLWVKSKSYKYKQDTIKNMQDDHLSMDDGGFATFELRQSRRGTLCKNSLSRKSSSTIIAKSPPRPSPASVTYSDDEDVKAYDENCDSSSLTEKPSEISSTDSQGDSDADSDIKSKPHSFVNHYANVNDTLRQSWKRQKPVVKPPSYTDSEPEGSVAVSLNGGHIIMNNMAGSRAPLPGFSSFV